MKASPQKHDQLANSIRGYVANWDSSKAAEALDEIGSIFYSTLAKFGEYDIEKLRRWVNEDARRATHPLSNEQCDILDKILDTIAMLQ